MSLQLHLVLLILAAALMHAAWNAMMKASGDRFLTLTMVIGVGGAVCLPALIIVEPPAAASWPYLAASFVIHQAYFALLIQAYRFGDLSQVYPLARGLGPLLVTGLAAVVAAEWPNAFGTAGIGLVSGGIASLSLTGRVKREQDSKAVFYAAATGVIIALYTLVDGLGVRSAESSLGYIAWLMVIHGIPMFIGAIVFRRHKLRPFLKTSWKAGVVGGFLAVVSYGLAIYALGQGTMGHVAALRETSVLFGALIGALRFNEPFGPKRIAAAAAIMAGLVLLQIGG
ncbi:MAG: EamA family transporter [Rhodospirillales bacterium]|nr:EamA family transporter [Rhodospirillales bacterium]